MRSESMTVDDYLAEVPGERRECLKQWRDDCRELLTGFTESMTYGMPGYARDSEIEVASPVRSSTSRSTCCEPTSWPPIAIA